MPPSNRHPPNKYIPSPSTPTRPLNSHPIHLQPIKSPSRPPSHTRHQCDPLIGPPQRVHIASPKSAAPRRSPRTGAEQRAPLRESARRSGTIGAWRSSEGPLLWRDLATEVLFRGASVVRSVGFCSYVGICVCVYGGLGPRQRIGWVYLCMQGVRVRLVWGMGWIPDYESSFVWCHVCTATHALT